MPSDGQLTDRQRPSSRARLILPFAAMGLFVACVGVWMHGSQSGHTVSHVHRTVRDIALAAGVDDAPADAGTLGPWKIAAQEVDPVTGEYRRFRLESGRMMISAARARLLVDPEDDSFSFEMWDVVYTRLPARGQTEDDSFVWSMDHYLLGPAPYGMDIVPDHEGGGHLPTSGESSSIVSAR